VLTAEEIAAVEATGLRIIALRRQRAARWARSPEPSRRIVRFRRHGIELEAYIQKHSYLYPVRGQGKVVIYQVAGWNGSTYHQSWRDAFREWLIYQPKRIGMYNVYRRRNDLHKPMWIVSRVGDLYQSYPFARSRRELARVIREDRQFVHEAALSQTDPAAPDTLGWRVWMWDRKHKKLRSPHQGTMWHTPELRVESWDSHDAVRGYAGIHAARMPRDWHRAQLMHHQELQNYGRGRDPTGLPYIVGVVERFGKYVLGTEGWRAEIVVIRKLRAPIQPWAGTRKGLPGCGSLLRRKTVK
jgi:hypothetical protein